ncbi:hypothetical protein [Streptomyces sp. NPDC087437]|uniref:hypothetical protein n=1 Tax=Streptomyces sp. NPDC087437 TaxID=3365789 RepID=UPI0037FD6431
MRFEEYAAEWKAGQRDPGPASLVHLESLLAINRLPLLGGRRMNTFDHKVVEDFIQTMERNGVGLAAQSNAVDKLKAILLDAHRLGLFDDNPATRTAGDDSLPLVADLMSGCGMRNGEAFAVNVNNIVADDVYRISRDPHRLDRQPRQAHNDWRPTRGCAVDPDLVMPRPQAGLTLGNMNTTNMSPSDSSNPHGAPDADVLVIGAGPTRQL